MGSNFWASCQAVELAALTRQDAKKLGEKGAYARLTANATSLVDETRALT